MAGVVVASLVAYRPDDDRSGLVPPTGSLRATTIVPNPSPGLLASAAASPSAEPSVTPIPVEPTIAAPWGGPDTMSPPPDLVIAPDATPLHGIIDPFLLPRYPGAVVIGMEEGVDGSVTWTLIEYAAVDATLDAVREHYRSVFRDTAWLVGDVDFADGAWSFTASQGDRETQLEISVDEDDIVRVSAYITEIVPDAAPSPTPRAQRTRDRADQRDRDRPRLQQQRPGPNRDRPAPRYRGGDDDDHDDGDDD